MADRKAELCQKRHHEDNINPEPVKHTPPAKNLTDLKDDCIQHIFEQLKLEDLLNVANSSIWLNSAACSVFSKFHGQTTISMLLNGCPRICVSRANFTVGSLKTGFQFLRCFGRFITKLKVNYEKISNRNCARINQYIQMYCATSLTEISLCYAPEFQENTFPKVESVSVVGGNLVSHLPKFAKWFPQMRRLEFDCNNFFHLDGATFPHLEHLRIRIINNDPIDNNLMLESVAALLRSNDLRSLEIGFLSRTVTFNEFIQILGIQPLITTLIVLEGITSSTLTDRNLARFGTALPSLIELDLSLTNLKLSAPAATRYIRQVNSLRTFKFLLSEHSRQTYLHQNLDNEWQIFVRRDVITLER